jgi:hypothetical protein
MIPKRVRRFGPIAPPPGLSVRVAANEAFLVPLRVAYEKGEELGREHIQSGLTRPADSHKADIEGAQLVWVPLWRVDAAVDGANVGVRNATGARAKFEWVLPRGKAIEHREGVFILLGRRLMPFDPSPAITLPLADMVSRTEQSITEGEELVADVARDEIEREVAARLRLAIQPRGEAYANFEVRYRSTVLCHYPIWLRRYRYEGEASGGDTIECHVAVSGFDGRVVSEKHPAAWRAMAGRVKRLFTRK